MATDEPAVLDEQSCHALLRSRSFGRLGFVDDEGVAILPVNYAVGADGDILLRTAAGSKLVAARHRDHVALEVDAADQQRRSGWSVLVRGTLSEVTDSEEIERLRSAVDPLAGGERPHVLRLRPESISGRRVPLERGQALTEQAWTDRDGTDLLG